MKKILLALALIVSAAGWFGFRTLSVELETPLPQTAPAELLEQFPGYLPGPHAVAIHTGPELPRSVGRPPMPLKLFVPDTSGLLPLVIFSPGYLADMHQYDRVLYHWASHGYLVITTNHLDADGDFLSGILRMWEYSRLELMLSRPEDLQLILDGIEQIEQQLPMLSGRIKNDRVVAAGHSAGGFSAQSLAGATTFDADGNSHTHRDQRVVAVIAISPPGPMFDMITETSWVGVETPMLITTGTWDVNAIFWPDWRLHRLSWDTAPTGEKHALVVSGADHYLGNLICRTDRDVEPQWEALRLVNASSTAFLDTYLRGESDANSILTDGVLAGTTDNFATLSTR